MKQRLAVLLLSLTLLIVRCSLPANPISPGIPVTGNTVAPPSLTSTPPPVSTSALYFDGRDDYIRVEDNPSLDLQNSFTIAAWIYLEEYVGWASLVTKGDKPNINNYAIQQSEALDPVYRTDFGKLRFSGCARLAAPLPESETVLSLKTWHFVAVTFDGLQIRFYTDGRLDGSSAVQGPLCTNDKPLYIGVDFPLTTEYWNGAIDELRIWNATLPESLIQEMMQGNRTASQTPFDNSLVGDWTFDEGTGSIAHDRSVYGNDGQLIGDPIWIRSSAPVQ